MKVQELMDAMKDMLDQINEVDPQVDVSEVLKNSKLGEMYVGCLNDEDIKDIPNKKAANSPTLSLDEITEMMM